MTGYSYTLRTFFRPLGVLALLFCCVGQTQAIGKLKQKRLAKKDTTQVVAVGLETVALNAVSLDTPLCVPAAAVGGAGEPRAVRIAGCLHGDCVVGIEVFHRTVLFCFSAYRCESAGRPAGDVLRRCWYSYKLWAPESRSTSNLAAICFERFRNLVEWEFTL